MPRDALGQFEHQVMLAILQLHGEAYSVPLVLHLEERTDREVAQSAVYIALRRLEEKGLLTSRMDESAVAETGRVRRYFSLTEAGLERLRRSRETLFRLWEGLDALFDDG